MYGTPEAIRGLRFTIHHLLAGLRYRELVAVLTDPHYIEAMAEAGYVFEVIDIQTNLLNRLNNAAGKKAGRLGAAASYAGSRSQSSRSVGDLSGRRPRAVPEDEEGSILDVVLEVASPTKSVMTTADEVGWPPGVGTVRRLVVVGAPWRQACL